MLNVLFKNGKLIHLQTVWVLRLLAWRQANSSEEFYWWVEFHVFKVSSFSGRQLPFIVNFKKNICQIFDVEWEKITHSFTFPEGCNLIDVDYFPTKEGQLGILVGVEDPNQILGSENFVVALTAVPDEPTMRVTHSAEIPVKITIVKTLFSSFDMAEGVKHETLGLFPRLLSWDHIVAIGCKETRCYLTQLTTVVTSHQIVIHRAKKNQINLMGESLLTEIAFTQLMIQLRLSPTTCSSTLKMTDVIVSIRLALSISQLSHSCQGADHFSLDSRWEEF